MKAAYSANETISKAVSAFLVHDHVLAFINRIMIEGAVNGTFVHPRCGKFQCVTVREFHPVSKIVLLQFNDPSSTPHSLKPPSSSG